MIARISGMVLLVTALAFVVYAQPPGILSVKLMDPPEFIDGGSYNCQLDTDFSSYSDTTWFEYRRLSIAPPDAYTDTSGWIRATNFTFTGAEDSVVVAYQVRAKEGPDGEPTEWSPLNYPSGESFIAMHDLDQPRRVRDLSHCSDGSDITLTWSDPGDGASGVAYYYVLRKTGSYTQLNYITPEELDIYRIAYIPASEDGFQSFTDTSPREGEVNHYTVVPEDRVGNFCPSNDIVSQDPGGPPPCAVITYAPLVDIPDYTNNEFIQIEIDITETTVRAFHRFRYRMIDTDTGDTTITDWTTNLYHIFELEECHTYKFAAQAKNLSTSFVSGWFDPEFMTTTRDMEGPINAEWISAEPREAGIYVEFDIDEEMTLGDLDCGSGFLAFHLFRVNLDSFPSDIITDIESYAGTDYEVATYSAAYDLTPYRYFDDGPDDLDVDLEDEDCYRYFVFAEDSFGHWSDLSELVSADACVDKGVAPPHLLELPEYISGADIILEFEDTTYCDITEIYFEYAFDDGFSLEVSTTPWLPIDDSSLHIDYPIDSTCEDIDTLSKHFLGLPESEYCFRAKTKDAVGSISEWSNIVCTTLDYTPPNVVRSGSILSKVHHTDQIQVVITWEDATESGGLGSGVSHYELWHSTDPDAPFETLLDEIPDYTSGHDTYQFVHNSPDPTDNWANNFYTIVSVDRVGNKITDAGRLEILTFPEYTPPHTPMIDTIYYEVSGSDERYVIEWTDPSPSSVFSDFHVYRILHSTSSAGLFLGDTVGEDAIVSYDGSYSGASRAFIPADAISVSGEIYFHMFTESPIDEHQSGYSEIYEYTNEVPEETYILSLDPGWNLVSLPVYRDDIEAQIDAYSEITGIFAWDPVSRIYEEADDLSPGYGYWINVNVSGGVNVVLEGVPVENIFIPIENSGWFIVGSTYYSDICYGYEGSLLDGPWAYDTEEGIYASEDRLNPGEGYWLLFSTHDNYWYAPVDCKAGFDYRSYESIVNLSIGEQQLNLASSNMATDMLDAYDNAMPPMAPGVEVDAYLMSDDGYRLITDARNDSKWDLYIEKTSMIEWSVSDGSIIIDGTDYENSNSIELNPGVYKVEFKAARPEDFALISSYPNPFNSATNLSFNIPENGRVKVEIYDHLGHLIRTLHDGTLERGKHEMLWNGTDDSGSEQTSGVFFCRITYNNQSATKRLLYVR